MLEFYIIIARKILFPEFWGQGSTCPLVSYAYGSCNYTPRAA